MFECKRCKIFHNEILYEEFCSEDCRILYLNKQNVEAVKEYVKEYRRQRDSEPEIIYPEYKGNKD